MAEMLYIFKQKFSDSFDTLKNTSYDKENNIYLCNSSMSVIDFDDVTQKLYPKKQPSSYDSIIIEEKDKKVFYIEFKNQDKTDISNKILHNKVKCSDETILNICKTNNIKKDNYNYVLCIVYKTTNTKYQYRRFEKNTIHFELRQYIPKYFGKIITNDIEFFKKEFNKQYGCDKNIVDIIIK